MKTIGIIVLIVLSTSCGVLSKKPYRERLSQTTEECVIRLFNEGIGEENAYAICKDIYNRSKEAKKN